MSLSSSKGPIFANILLADEINRTPPKTQAALLEAMEELQVTVQGVTYPMERPFFVLATQNPIELEGTYPLPEAQLDRFMFNIIIDYLIGRRRTSGGDCNDCDTGHSTRTDRHRCRISLNFRNWCGECRFRNRSRVTRSRWCAPAVPARTEVWISQRNM